MITIKIESLREFQKNVQFINTNTILPILSNLKLEYNIDGWDLVKNNLEAICIGRIIATGEPATVLIDERILFSFLATTSAEELTINIDSAIHISDGNTKIDLPLEDPVGYPLTPKYSKESILKLTKQHLRAIKIASNFISRQENSGNFQYVHITPGNGIFGFHNNFFYINNVFLDLPEISLRYDECNVICAVEAIDFINQPNHHIFLNGKYAHIFTKSEAKPISITGIIDRLKLPGKDVSVSRDGLSDFCSIANIVSESPLAACLLAPAGQDSIKLSLVEANYNRATERVLACAGQPDEFGFDSRLMGPAIRAVPYEQLHGKTNQNCLIIGGTGGAGNGLGSEINEWFCFIGLQR